MYSLAKRERIPFEYLALVILCLGRIASNMSGILAGDEKGRRRRKDPKYLFAFIGFWHEMGGTEVGLAGDGR